MRRERKISGFSLIEIMVALAILGILAAMAASNHRKFVGLARRLEARTTIAAIAGAQMIARFDTNQWACTFDELAMGEELTRVNATQVKGKLYTYQLACDANGYRVTGTADIDGDAWPDVAVGTPHQRFAMQYDDLTDGYNASVGAPTAIPPPASTPAPTPAATAIPAPTPGNGKNKGLIKNGK